MIKLLSALNKTISFVGYEATYWVYDLMAKLIESIIPKKRKKLDKGDGYNKDCKNSNYNRH